MAKIHTDLVAIAIDKCGREAFERYAQTVFGQVVGPKFKPLGGLHDGGADGFIEPDAIFEDVVRPTRFFQASKQITVPAKLRHTITSLRKGGRDVQRLYFASSQVVPNSDRTAYELGDELEVQIEIFDRVFFEQHANDSAAVQAAFEQYLRPSLAFLNDIQGPSFPTNTPISNAQAVCAFLGQELERRVGTVKTLQGVCDGLILWALEGTDPNKGVLMTEAEIIAKVISVIPSARRFFRGEVGHRLQALQSKTEGQRVINYHRRQDAYCLPYATREAIRETTVQDEKLKSDVTASFIARLRACGAEELDSEVFQLIPALLHGTLEGVFERQGADAARHFLDAGQQGDALNTAAILDVAREQLHASPIPARHQPAVEKMMRAVLRDVFYASKPEERAYCSRLSRTYVLLFTLRNTPEVIEYFNSMARNFELAVGSDIILRALSEHCLPSEDQMGANSLRIIRQAGSTLYLTQSTLEELHSHIWAADREYHSTYREIESLVDFALASQIDRILIRAYYYAKLDKSHAQRPKSWAQFIGNFLSYNVMQGPTSPASMKTLRDTLCNRFGFQFLTHEAMSKNLPPDDVERLTEKIYEIRRGVNPQDRTRARNDALQILRVHEARQSEDRIGGNPFGYRSWWLTQETLSSAAAAVVFPDRRHNRYVMRPDFLVSYIAYNPTTADVRTRLRTIYPSIHGVRLASRIDEATLEKVVRHLRDAHRVDPARAMAMLSEYGDALKSSKVREFTVKYDKSSRR